MLRVVRIRLDRLRFTKLTGKSAGVNLLSTSANERVTADVQEQYGNAYGAGPSRIPYTPHDIQGDSTSRGHPHRYNETARLCDLRRYLQSIASPGHYASTETFRNSLASRVPQYTTLDDLSRLELHTIVHHLIRARQLTLAAFILARAVEHGNHSSPRRRIFIRRRTLNRLLESQGEKIYANAAGKSKGPSHQAALNSFLELSTAMQSIRHPRPQILYQILIQACVNHGRPDKAAEVFVGLVEEWVTEGRIAEGADADAFHEGGGLPSKLGRGRRYARNKSWWTGVRDWSFPGEVLSPHDRLDLWHPAKLSLGEKLRHFPFPVATSPPSVVPFPSNKLMGVIIGALRLDPSVASPDDFQASMRACAILANTVISRTLPVTVLGPLLRAFESTPSIPAVYPVHMTSPPADNAWAYQAYTQVHLALQSFLFSPPISAASFAQARAHEAIITGGNFVSRAHEYRLQPLSFNEGVTLVRYALEKLRLPPILTRLMGYLKHTFELGRSKPALWNALLYSGTHLGDKRMTDAADDALFGQTAFAREADRPNSRTVGAISGEAETSSSYDIARKAKTSRLDRSPSIWSPPIDLSLDMPDPIIPPQANEQSIITLIYHLGKTSQFPRLVQLTYTLIPFLTESRTTRNVDTTRTLDSPNDDTSEVADGRGVMGRLLPTTLTPGIYSALLSSLALANKLLLAQRVYSLALQAEDQWRQEHDRSDPDGLAPFPEASRLPIELFTAMMRLWANEVARSDPSRRTPSSPHFRPHRSLIGEPTHVAASHMALATYRQASKRWNDARQLDTRRWKARQASAIAPVPSAFRPDAAFFNWTTKGLAPILTSSDGPLSESLNRSLSVLIRDMKYFGQPIPVQFRDHAGISDEVTESPSIIAPGDRVRVDTGEDARDMLRNVAVGLLRAEKEGIWRDNEARRFSGAAEAPRRDVARIREAELA